MSVSHHQQPNAGVSLGGALPFNAPARFEEFLAGLLRSLNNLRADECHQEIEAVLHRTIEIFGCDHGALHAFPCEEMEWGEAGSWIVSRPGVHTALAITPEFTWLYGRARESAPTLIAAPGELPPEARQEKQGLIRGGLNSLALVPSTVCGRCVGALMLSARSKRRWSHREIQRLRLIGEAFAAAMDRSRADRQLRLARAAWQSANDRILIADAREPNLPIVYASRSFEMLTGYSQDEIVGRNCRFMQGRGTDYQVVARIRDALRHGEPFRGEILNYRKNGEPFWNSLRIAPLRNSSGEITHFVGTQTGVSRQKQIEEALNERLRFQQLLAHVSGLFINMPATQIDAQVKEALRENERRMRLITDALPVLIAYVDSEERFRFANKGCEQWFGIPRGEILGRKTREIVGEPAYAIIKEHVAKVLSGQEVHFEMLAPYGGGMPRELDAKYVPDRDKSGNVHGYYALVQDVSQRKRAEREAQHQREQLTHVMRVATMGELAASIAHELNQPLAAILSNAQAAQRLLNMESPDLAEVREALQDIVADDKRAGGVISRLRALVSKQGLELSPVNLNRTIRETVDLVKNDALARKIDITIELDANLPEVRGDRVQLQQVVLNLVLNAFDAMCVDPDAPRSLTMRTSTSRSSISVAVRDTGIGLSSSSTDKLFTPFFTTKIHGMGMGLSISRSIIEAYGGRLRAVPNRGRGATFEFALPICGEDPP